MDSPGPTTHLDFVNVAIALSFVLFNVVIATFFQLGIARSLFTAAVRCVLQLTVVALLLQRVFESKNPFGVAGIAGLSDFV